MCLDKRGQRGSHLEEECQGDANRRYIKINFKTNSSTGDNKH